MKKSKPPRTLHPQPGVQFLLEPEDESRFLTTSLEPTDPRFDFQRRHDPRHTLAFTITPGKIGLRNTSRPAGGQQAMEN